MPRIKWPEEVPVLTARDIHKGAYHGPRGTHCAIGWLMRVFDNQWGYMEARRTMAELIDDESIASWNDDPDTFKAEIARTFNKMTAKLGYVVNNPEA